MPEGSFKDISDEFDNVIVSYFADRYFSAKTPNPCVYCNKMMKFPKLLAYADKMGIEKVATGHYVSMKNGRIIRAEDKRKDQKKLKELGMNTEVIRKLVDLWVYKREHREIFFEKLESNKTYEQIAEERNLTPQRIKDIVYEVRDLIIEKYTLSR